MTLTPEQIIRKEILALKAYHVPDATGLVKLDAMENPYQWSTTEKLAWLSALEMADVNRYPDPSSSTLRATIRKAFAIESGLEILLGNGSDELIQIIISAIASDDASVMSFAPGFVMYDYIAQFARVNYVSVALDENFDIDLDKSIDAIKTHNPAVIFIAYPNNPTGNLFSDEKIEAIVQQSNGLVVIDEAYTPFAQKSWLTRIKDFDNLLVLRTVSKMGLAGLRLGYLVGKAAWIHEFDKIRLPYNINVLTQVSAEYALQNIATLDKQTARIRQDRDKLISAMQQMAGVKVFPSQANFVLFRVGAGQGDVIFNRLLEKKILIKNLAYAGPVLKDCLRVTVGAPDENKLFLKALKEVLL
jgi:histidinol-phosphate aminotransferase